ncbi:thiamine ABC transporter ATP-binding protein [Martelella mediterranea]|uniref:Thiamine transport system ATP-binding protein n=1 Tax=Martelella mediterranea TaxID=293089 RepID=A0A4R3NR09_9HYPH|nr:ATP-binding cassette domain-containing protein [Martelella mediterranea]TCT35272.1 thiamine transport system ATP-binding protein [Martelella mediterranea]
MMKSADIALENVTLTLGENRFNFDGIIAGGAINAVTGRSGSGKTTLVNLIAGFEAPSTGRIIIGDKVMNGIHIADRPVTLVFQDNNLFAHLDIFTNIGLGIDPALKLSPDDKARISKALERVGLKGFEKRKVASLSGGERQRAAFARALVRNRPVLLLDEPFAALDPDTRAEMGALLVELHRETGNTVVMVSHEPDEMDRLADHRLVIEHGRFSARY